MGGGKEEGRGAGGQADKGGGAEERKGRQGRSGFKRRGRAGVFHTCCKLANFSADRTQSGWRLHGDFANFSSLGLRRSC